MKTLCAKFISRLNFSADIDEITLQNKSFRGTEICLRFQNKKTGISRKILFRQFLNI